MEWWENSPDSFPEHDHELAKVLVGYHHHRLDKAWVSVKDRLPKTNGWYNVVSDRKVIPLMFSLLIGWHDETGRIDSLYWNHDVTHWRPLPEPPKEMK